jgi:hypothetical protein
MAYERELANEPVLALPCMNAEIGDKMARPPRQSSSPGAACGFWIRAWGQREAAIQRTGRLKGPTRWQADSRVGWTCRPLTSSADHFTGNTLYGR